MEERFELPSAKELKERCRLEELEYIKSKIDPLYVKEFFDTYLYPSVKKGYICLILKERKDKEFFERDPNLKEYLRLSGYRIDAGYDSFSDTVLWYKVSW